MAAVIRLKQCEDVQMDPACIAAIFADIGASRAEGHVMDLVEALSIQSAHLERAIRRTDIAAIPDHAILAAHLADTLGLVSFSAVLGDLVTVAQHSDLNAVSAVWERLTRIGDRSLAALWEVPGLAL